MTHCELRRCLTDTLEQDCRELSRFATQRAVRRASGSQSQQSSRISCSADPWKLRNGNITNSLLTISVTNPFMMNRVGQEAVWVPARAPPSLEGWTVAFPCHTRAQRASPWSQWLPAQTHKEADAVGQGCLRKQTSPAYSLHVYGLLVSEWGFPPQQKEKCIRNNSTNWLTKLTNFLFFFSVSNRTFFEAVPYENYVAFRIGTTMSTKSVYCPCWW